MKKCTLILILLFCNLLKASAQGCSDAGVCSAGSSYKMEADSMDESKAAPTSISITASAGFGEQGVAVYQVLPELNIGITKKLSWQVRVPFLSISGNLAAVSGVGDVTSGFSFVAIKNKTNRTTIYGGIKIPASDANIKKDNRSLPMPYQTSLGTLDFLGAISTSVQNWKATLGYQRVLDNGNKNQFTRALWVNNKDAQTYFESNGFIRGDDASFKVEYNYETSKWMISPGILAIYRLNEDQLLDANNVHRPISQSDGLTLNLTANARYETGKKSAFMLQFGFPVIIRKVRADGLTRSAVLNLTYSYQLNR